MNTYLKSKDYSVTGEEFNLLYDAEKEMLLTHPQPKEFDKYYKSDTYISHTDARKTVLDKIYQGVKKYNLRKKVRLASKYGKKRGALLDVGAGTGDFLLLAKSKGWEVDGVEPSSVAKHHALKKGIQLFDDLDSLQDKKYDVITLWHVLEHLPNLDVQIEKLIVRLEEGGALIIAVPNFKSYDATYYGNYWAAYDVPRHLWHFSRTAIQKVFGKHGMNVLTTKPMLFDAFYVSLLSEKYKKGRTRFINAFYTGLKSNLKAWHNKEYSSVIYILKKP